MPRNTITLSMRLETNVNLGKKESKIRSTPNSENKIKNWGSIRTPSPPTPASRTLSRSPLPCGTSIFYYYITVLQHYHRIFSYILEQLYHYLKCCYTVILQYFETVFFYPSDLPHRAHLFQAVLISLSKCCLPCGKNISFKRMRFVQRNVCLNTHAYSSFYEENT